MQENMHKSLEFKVLRLLYFGKVVKKRIVKMFS